MEGVKGYIGVGLVWRGVSMGDFGKAFGLCFWDLTCGVYTKIAGWMGLVSGVALPYRRSD